MKTKSKVSDSDYLRLRVAEAKAELQSLGHRNYLKDFIAENKQYNNHAGISSITAVFQLRKADEVITNKIEAFVLKLKKQS